MAGGPLVGYNNNVPYDGHVYHVQTEDSGSQRPHVITHLFADGGRVVKTCKTRYGNHLGAQDRKDLVRTLMRDQHNKMVVALRGGELDELLKPGAVPVVEEVDAPRIIQVAAPSAPGPPPGPAAPTRKIPSKAERVTPMAASGTPSVSRPPPPSRISRARDPSSRGPAAVAGSRQDQPTPISGGSGSYRYLGTRSSKPPPDKPAVRAAASVQSTSTDCGPEGSSVAGRASMTSDAPPALDPTAPRRPHRVSERDGRGARSGRRPPAPGIRTASHTASHTAPNAGVVGFGGHFISTRRFDEVVAAFLLRRPEK